MHDAGQYHARDGESAYKRWRLASQCTSKKPVGDAQQHVSCRLQRIGRWRAAELDNDRLPCFGL